MRFAAREQFHPTPTPISLGWVVMDLLKHRIVEPIDDHVGLSEGDARRLAGELERRKAGWTPNWTLDPVPCEHPETCGPQQPICLACIAGFRAFRDDGHPASEWQDLKEWQREAWRREALDA